MATIHYEFAHKIFILATISLTTVRDDVKLVYTSNCAVWAPPKADHLVLVRILVNEEHHVPTAKMPMDTSRRVAVSKATVRAYAATV